ncbi:MAG: PQQ-binding-like beta-propeller repeat protein [Candidatus Limnocylindria bacterium]
MAYPPGWRLKAFDQQIDHLGAIRGSLVSNVHFRFRHPDLGEGAQTSAWDMRGLPPDAVVVEFHYLVRPELTTEEPDTPFPLSLDRAQRVRDRPAYGAPQPRLFLPVIVGGKPGYAVFAWFGPQASPSDRAIAERVVASIRFAGSDAAESPGCLDQIATARATEGSDALWRFRLQDWNVTAPVLVADTVYVGSNGPFAEEGCLFALDAATGTVPWSRAPGIDAYTVPVPVEDTVVVALGGTLYGLDPDKGEERWSQWVGTVEGEVVADGTLVFVTGSDGVTAVDARTGRVAWERTGLGGPLLGPPVNAGRNIYVSSPRGDYPLRLHALEASSGRLDWTAPALGIPVAAGDGMVLVEQAPNTLHGHDAVTGEERWRLNVPGGASTRPVIVGEVAVVAADDGSAFGIEVETGQVRWKTAVGVFRTPLVVGEQLVNVGTTRGVYALDPVDGSVAWSLRTADQVQSLALQEGALIAGAGGHVHGVDPGTGSTLWQVTAGRRVNRTPTYEGNRVFVRDGTQAVVAVRVPQ